MCKHEGCNTRPTFALKGEKEIYCKKHKLENMINVKDNYCLHEGCTKVNPNYGIKKGKGLYCLIHKTKEMFDVKTKRCEYEGCDSHSPTFNIKGSTKGKFCVTHKTNEMVNVVSKKCEYEDCNTQATFGKPGHSRNHCAKHREKGMILYPNSKCKSCKEPAIYGTNWKPLHCETHKTADEENYVEQPCSSCGLIYILDKENKCENCNPESFKTARLAKQNGLMDYLDARGLKGSSTDTIVEDGLCGKERPDRVYELVDKIVILECDEHQHRDRACLCEQTRMVNIGQTYGGMPVYFIRWNPDNYYSEKEPEILRKRYKLVGDLISSIKKGKIVLPDALVSVIYMYYDDWSSLAEEEWKVLTEFNSNPQPQPAQ